MSAAHPRKARRPPAARAVRPRSDPDRDALADALEALVAALRGARGWPLPIASGSALEAVTRAFSLTDFEVAVLLLAVASELQPEIDGVLESLTGEREPTVGAALAALPEPRWDALLPESTLRARRLIRLSDGEVLTRRALRVEEAVLHALLGRPSLEPRIARRVVDLGPAGVISETSERAAERVVDAWLLPTRPAVHLSTGEPDAARSVVARAAELSSARALRLDARDIPIAPDERAELLALIGRESRLAPLAWLVELPPQLPPELERAAADFLTRMEGRVTIAGRDALFSLDRSAVRVEVAARAFAERRLEWEAALGDDRDGVDVDVLAAQFRVDRATIRSAVDASRIAAEHHHRQRALWRACGAASRPRLADLAQPVRLEARLDDVILPDTQRRALRAVVGHVRHRARVAYEWGFAARGERGLGTAAIFAGPSGTGKTMAAEAIANELELDLFRIDLSAVVSKYIGETEENLGRVFDAAESGGAILLFDEADALFGKRTEVKDAHDRHANVEVGYLLQRLEAYTGVALLTTNLRKSIDDAFLRRMQIVIDFPFPDAPLREQIWRGIFPRETPLGAIDYRRLAQLTVAGGNIRSIARNAAYLAAGDGAVVEMRHLADAARLEYAKLGKSPPSLGPGL